MFFYHSTPGDDGATANYAEGKVAEARLVLPLLPLRDLVLFPGMTVSLTVGRSRSIRAIERSLRSDKNLLLVAQRDAAVTSPRPDELYRVGTVSTILELSKLTDGTIKVKLIGRKRAHVEQVDVNRDCLLCAASIQPISESVESKEARGLVSATQDLLRRMASYTSSGELNADLLNPDIECAAFADLAAAQLRFAKLSHRQELLEELHCAARLEKLYPLVQSELEIMRSEQRIQRRVRKQVEKSQRDFFLNEQITAIKRELGERDESKVELGELEATLKGLSLPERVREKAEREMRKLRRMQPVTAEAAVVRHYLEWIVDLPWERRAPEKRDIEEAERVLGLKHHGLDKVKQRIIEHLAVLSLVEEVRGPTLCFVGPPGVGKTSLARSIADATGRPFVRIALGGVRDEAEIRGHRRTYIGSLPGKIVQALKRAQADNPVILLDEIDKLSTDFRGDPSSALLEVLDPEQNHEFADHYMELDIDLSRVMFVATANTMSRVPAALRDRLEVIELPGYTEEEKLDIARLFLLPKQLRDLGLATHGLELGPHVLRTIIRFYTREQGVRSLERELASILRKHAVKLVKQQAEDGPSTQPFVVKEEDLTQLLGSPRFRSDVVDGPDTIGLTTGLAFTDYGGSILDCEVAVVPGKGKLFITGLLEKGMQESAQAAMSYIRSRHEQLGLPSSFNEKVDVHVHFPEFIPKDGPSAGVTIATSIASALMKVPVRRSVAMTGEVTLQGRVRGVGGLKEKVLAAYRAGLSTLLLPLENMKDVSDLPKEACRSTRLLFVEHMDQVLREALISDRVSFLEAPPVKEYHLRRSDPRRGEPAPHPPPS